MIPILAGSDPREAARLRDAINSAGLSSRLIDAAPDIDTAFMLSHVSALADAVPRADRVVVFGGDDTALAAMQSVRSGAADYLPGGIAADIAIARVRQELADTVVEQPTAIAISPGIKSVFDIAARVARTDISVLIGGESGSGKEVLARYLHDASDRASGPFVAVNCAAIPETMLEAMLFGHEKGAFTGASDKRIGKFELADGGTLLLDEITEMPVGLQAKLLRVLQERELERLGSHRVVKVDVRVIATSNRDLASAVKDGVLREDLYYRLSVFPLTLPPLRERPDDILALAQHFLDKHSRGRSLTLAQEACDGLCAHDWPGNVRELENAMQRATVLTHGSEVQIADLALPRGAATTEANSLGDKLRDTESDVLLKTLAAQNGVRKATAEALGISERTLRYKLKDLRERGLM